MNVEIYIPDVLWHRYKRTFPNGDLGALLRQAMQDSIKEHDKNEPSSMFNKIKRLREQLG